MSEFSTPHEPRELPTTCALHSTRLDALARDVTDIKQALLGHQPWGQPGLVQRMERTEQEVRGIKAAMVKLDVRVSIIAAGISVGAFALKYGIGALKLIGP
jgi:hypothetical protein